MEEQEKIYMTEFDMKFQGGNLQIIKAILPFIDINQQRILAVYIKFLEFSNTLNYFNNGRHDVGICNTVHDKKSPLEMLNCIKEYCNKSQRESLEMIINYFNIMEMFQTYKDMMGNSDIFSFHNDNEEPNENYNANSDYHFNPMDMMKTMLTPEQQSMFETYSALFNNSDLLNNSDAEPQYDPVEKEGETDESQ